MNYFTIKELTKSSNAARLGIDNTPSAATVANLNNLIAKVLNPARKKLGCPIIVNSGYRSPALNLSVGGAKKSYHLQGRAADLNAGTKAQNRALYAILKELPHTELINEKDATWIHVAL